MPHFVTDDGIRLHFEVCGRGPIPVVGLHLMGGDSATWTGLTASVEPELARWAVLDFRGHGESWREPCAFDIDRLVRDVLALADRLDWPRFVIAGHSFGGKVALRVATLAAQRVQGLVLIGAVGPGLVALDRPTMEGILQRAAEIDFMREVFRPWFQVWPRPEIDRAIASFAQTPHWALHRVCESALWTDLTPEMREITAPTLLIAGDADPVYGPSYQKQAVRPFVVNVTEVTIPNCGHGLILESPEEIAVHVNRFLRAFG